MMFSSGSSLNHDMSSSNVRVNLLPRTTTKLYGKRYNDEDSSLGQNIVIQEYDLDEDLYLEGSPFIRPFTRRTTPITKDKKKVVKKPLAKGIVRKVAVVKKKIFKKPDIIPRKEVQRRLPVPMPTREPQYVVQPVIKQPIIIEQPTVEKKQYVIQPVLEQPITEKSAVVKESTSEPNWYRTPYSTSWWRASSPLSGAFDMFGGGDKKAKKKAKKAASAAAAAEAAAAAAAEAAAAAAAKKKAEKIAREKEEGIPQRKEQLQRIQKEIEILEKGQIKSLVLPKKEAAKETVKEISKISQIPNWIIPAIIASVLIFIIVRRKKKE